MNNLECLEKAKALCKESKDLALGYILCYLEMTTPIKDAIRESQKLIHENLRPHSPKPAEYVLEEEKTITYDQHGKLTRPEPTPITVHKKPRPYQKVNDILSLVRSALQINTMGMSIKEIIDYVESINKVLTSRFMVEKCFEMMKDDIIMMNGMKLPGTNGIPPKIYKLRTDLTAPVNIGNQMEKHGSM